MAGPVFVVDARHTPLMPVAPAHARRLIERHRARRLPHHAFTVLQLAHTVPEPLLRPIVAHGVTSPALTTITLRVETGRAPLLLLRVLIPLGRDHAASRQLEQDT